MAVMCGLARGQSHQGTVKVLLSYVFQRQKYRTATESGESSMKHRPSTPQNHRKNPTKPELSRKQSDHPIKVDSSQNQSKQSQNVVSTQYQPYLEMLDMRREEAKRSILVEVERLADSRGLKSFCERLGPLNKCYVYRSSGKNLVFVEFKHENSKTEAVKYARHSKDSSVIPVTSPFLYFQNFSPNVSGSPALPDNTEDCLSFDDKYLQKDLQKFDCKNDERLKSEIDYLHKKSEISDLSLRLRFFTCHQLDIALGGLYQDIRAFPFGSSVSGFGRNNGDLDIYLQNRRHDNGKKSSKSRLFFHSKASMVQNKNLELKLIGDLISVLLPGCSRVVSILSARVPIIKYRQSLTNLDCDLQNCSASGVDLSHILWMMKHWDSRVAPLFFTLRLWAAHNNVCSEKKPSVFITNFSLMLMTIFYLQVQKILPSLHSLQNLSNISPSMDPNSALVFPDLRTIPADLVTQGTVNDSGVDSLLIGFFEFYSKFDYSREKISIYHGKSMANSYGDFLDIENPTDASLNVSKNVKRDGLLAFTRALNTTLKDVKDDYQLQSVTSIIFRTRETEKLYNGAHL